MTPLHINQSHAPSPSGILEGKRLWCNTTSSADWQAKGKKRQQQEEGKRCSSGFKTKPEAS
eukprot:scaffold10907_cov20-Tisochrysis_lutea.AAC.1